jgi:hypothetical protein
MDPVAFDTLARAIAQAGTRRRLLGRLLVGVPLLGALAPGREEALAAERPLERLQRRTPQRNRQQRNTKQNNQNKNNNNNNNKNPNKNQNNGPGTGRPLDCPDQHIECWTTAGGGLECGELKGTLGPLRMCWKIEDGCCPCGDDRTQAHWAEECNVWFPGCNGNCFAANEREFECGTLGYC